MGNPRPKPERLAEKLRDSPESRPFSDGEAQELEREESLYYGFIC
jgi:hypothetical protein